LRSTTHFRAIATVGTGTIPDFGRETTVGPQIIYPSPALRPVMYRARDEFANEEWLAELDAAADELSLDGTARERAADLFLSTVPERERSKRAVLAASLYAGALIAGDRRSQSAVAETVGVARLTVQKRWRDVLEESGLDAPKW
jgi:transcription initiation factor TFIIIB Brf1 subunit/transcription initiation factor TFIIB